ncbi:MAG: hypothetical protein WD010_01415 [Nitriliruptor sp.]
MTDQRPDPDPVPAPDFGPGGYLPERAAKRARKIVLRAPLGVQWIVASLLAGVVVVVAGVLLLTRGGGAPDPPFVEIGPVDAVAGQVVHDGDLDVLLVGLGGRIRAFDAPADVTYCEASRRLESPDGEVWSLTGRGTGGTASFAEHPTLTSDRILYVDPTAATTPPTPTDDTVPAGCS